jgi:hypothetical protein
VHTVRRFRQPLDIAHTTDRIELDIPGSRLIVEADTSADLDLLVGTSEGGITHQSAEQVW